MPSKLSSLRESLKILKAVFWYKRKPATHAFIFMIASDRRDTKPYAMPIQCIPCAGLTDKEIHQLTNDLIGEMVKRGMRISGMFKMTVYSVHVHRLQPFQKSFRDHVIYNRMPHPKLSCHTLTTPIRLCSPTLNTPIK